MIRNSRLAMFAALAISAGLAMECKQEQAAGTSTPIRIGGILSKTGPAAAYGEDADKGARLALEQAKKADASLPVEYVVMDDKSDKTEAVKMAQTLIDSRGVQAILGPAISTSALTVGKMADERGIPMVATSPTLDEVTVVDGKRRNNVFRVCFNDSFQGKAMASFVAKTLGKKKAAIVFDKTLPYSIGLAQTFRREFEKLGGSVPYEEFYSVNDTDYGPLISKVATFDVDALFIPGWDENVGPMIKQADGRWNKFVLIGGDGWPTNRLLELSGGKMPEAYALSHFIMDDPNPTVSAFVKLYKEKYKEDPTPFSALGYDAMSLLVDASKRAAGHTSPELRNAIEATNGLDLVTGKISFDADHNPRKAGIVVRIEPNGFHFRDRILP